ncbi:acid phosphatase AphA [Photobacterium aquimaris]|uniref:Class B acid phosphatase n=1 Tax=Photobacterium aquimaris TaxID=512643 RepID=A0A1Y6KWC1_9GAMM|nr:acid phosphatase AphA [Photobacterium aquimaris]SMY16352.1 Class B acid phosphatase precursor [Photobacterium aquimaris]
MKKTFAALTISSLLALSLVSCSAMAAQKVTPPDTGYTTVQLTQMGQPKSVDWVTVNQIAQQLKGKPPMAVGFDVDDTVLFSSPGFYRGQKEFSPNSLSFLNNQKFWNKMNCGWDKFSIPKKIGRELIAMHQKRGDDIYFITGRDPSKCEITTQYLKNVFGIKNMHKVIFAGTSKTTNTKTPYIKANNIKIYYGDSDTDITAARAAGAVGIRVMRAANSTNRPLAKNGDYGEEVVVNSQY